VLPIRDNVPTRRFPVVTVAIIVANLAVWVLYEMQDLNRAILDFGYFPCEPVGDCSAPGGTWWTDVFTSMFMHGGWEHIIFNMLFLWIFGNNVEDALGRVRFLLWYIAGGLAATLVQTFVTLHWGSAQDASIPNIGASGAIAAVLGAYFVLLPNARVLTAIFVILIFFQELPAVFFLGFWFLFQLWQGGFSIVQPESGGGVAFFAHVGGFVFGALTVRLVAVRRPLMPKY